MPVGSHIKELPTNFHRFGVLWTPTILVMDPTGNEVTRNEGYLPKVEFRAWMEMSLARVAFVQKQWDEAEERYGRVARERSETSVAPEAIYWQGVSRYKKGDHAALGETYAALAQKYPGSLWTRKASVWAG